MGCLRDITTVMTPTSQFPTGVRMRLKRHLRRMRELYPQRQQVLIDTLAQASPGRLVRQPSEQGLHLLRELPADVSGCTKP
jgi:DNA-binding transcriptional MocR family regulator